VAGYIGTVDAWQLFEIGWQRVLDNFNLPYFHMKEFFKNEGPFARFKKDDDDKTKLFASLAATIQSSQLRGFGSAVLVEDLRKFNEDYCESISAYALCVYSSFIRLSQYVPIQNFDEDVIEIILDRVDKPYNARVTIENYLHSDNHHIGLTDYMENRVRYDWLPKDLTSRQVRPLQAADFIAWETRKSAASKEPWLSDVDRKPRISERYFLSDYVEFMRKSGVKTFPFRPLERKSLNALAQAAETYASIWSYSSLEHAHEIRGRRWTVSENDWMQRSF
jgi:hypothetical protein